MIPNKGHSPLEIEFPEFPLSLQIVLNRSSQNPSLVHVTSQPADKSPRRMHSMPFTRQHQNDQRELASRGLYDLLKIQMEPLIHPTRILVHGNVESVELDRVAQG